MILTRKSSKSSISGLHGLHSVRGHHFYAELINSDSVVVDLGSHLGQFSSEITKSFGCKCYAVEALPSLYEKIPETNLIQKFNVAISSSSELVKFLVTDNPEGNHIVKSNDICDREIIAVKSINLEDFIRINNLSSIDLLKVDIEGAEIDLFNSVSEKVLNNIKQISIEFHDFKFDCFSQVKAIEKRLEKLGFWCIVFSISNHGDVLFINKSKCNISFLKYLWIKYIVKYFRAVSRYYAKLTQKLIE